MLMNSNMKAKYVLLLFKSYVTDDSLVPVYISGTEHKFIFLLSDGHWLMFIITILYYDLTIRNNVDVSEIHNHKNTWNNIVLHSCTDNTLKWSHKVIKTRYSLESSIYWVKPIAIFWHRKFLPPSSLWIWFITVILWKAWSRYNQ